MSKRFKQATVAAGGTTHRLLNWTVFGVAQAQSMKDAKPASFH